MIDREHLLAQLFKPRIAPEWSKAGIVVEVDLQDWWIG